MSGSDAEYPGIAAVRAKPDTAVTKYRFIFIGITL
jgi:hypothetical protein